jgi:hypothetical protein
MFLPFSLIIGGTTEKVLQYIMPIQSICKQNLGFIQQKIKILNSKESLQQ